MDELKKLIDEINAARREEEEKEMEVETFSIFWLFKEEGVNNPENNAREMEKIMEKCPYWRDNEKHEREVKRYLIKILIGSGMDRKNIIPVTKKIIRVLKGFE